MPSPLPEQQLASELRYMASQYPDVRVAFRGDGTASFQRVAEVLQVIRSTGVKQLGLQPDRNTDDAWCIAHPCRKLAGG